MEGDDIKTKVESPPKSKRTLYIAIAVIVLLGIIGGVIAGVVTANQVRQNTNGGRDVPKQTFGYKELFNGSFYARSVFVSWLSDTTYQYTTPTGDLVEFDVTTNKSKVLIPKDELVMDKLMCYNDYFLCKRKTFLLDPMGEGKSVRYMGWSATGHKLAFVYKNDVYMMPDPTKNTTFTRMTTTGIEGIVFNGVPDWNYEEEILGTDHALYWSKNSNFFCYGSFNASGVGSAHWMWYNGKASYIDVTKIQYPKAGTVNSKTNVYVGSASDPSTIKRLAPPQDLASGEYYYTNVVWASDTTVTVTWLNRIQHTSILMSCDARTAQCSEVNRVAVTNGWIDYHYWTPIFANAGDSYYTILPKKVSSGKTYNHIAKVTLSNKQKTWLTDGDWHVTNIYAYSETRNLLFFQSTEVSSISRGVYRVDTDGLNKKCLSCSLRPTECEYYTASFSKNGQFYLLGCRGPGIPSYHLINSVSGSSVTMSTNTVLKNAIKNYELSTRTFSTFQNGGYSMNVVVIRPPKFDPKKKYPVFLYVYGGPQSQRVDKQFRLGWTEYFSAFLNMIVVQIDPRGTGYRSNEFMYSTYKKLGVYEAEDCIAYAKQLKALPYVDPNKIAIFGWSYGAYVSGMVVGANSGAFNLALMVAPVSDWRFYDTGYTERFMSTPKDNLKGYESASVLNRLDGFRNMTVFIAHGNADDNVHFQNTAVLVKALQDKLIQFKMMMYPNRNHGISSYARRHLFTAMTNIIKETFNLPDPFNKTTTA